MKLTAVAVLFVAAAQASPPASPTCEKAVADAEYTFQRCASEGVVTDADGSPGTYGVGCTLDHVIAFANAYALLTHCAVTWHEPEAIREMRQLREFAQMVSSPASQRHLNNQ